MHLPVMTLAKGQHKNAKYLKLECHDSDILCHNEVLNLNVKLSRSENKGKNPVFHFHYKIFSPNNVLLSKN